MEYLIITLLLLRDNGVKVSPAVWVVVAATIAFAITTAFLRAYAEHQKKGGDNS